MIQEKSNKYQKYNNYKKYNKYKDFTYLATILHKQSNNNENQAMKKQYNQITIVQKKRY